MKKASSYAAVFTVGVAACALGLKTFGDPAALLSGTTPFEAGGPDRAGYDSAGTQALYGRYRSRGCRR